MKRIQPEEHWLESWKTAYHFDLMEMYGETHILGHTYAYQNRQQVTIDLVKQVVGPGAKILDVAAAQGNYSLLLAELGYDVTWNDLRSELADYVKLKHEKGTIHFAPGNAFELQFDQLFDLVLITEVIEHVAHPDDFLKKISQLVKPGGYIVMTTPNGEYFRNDLPKFSDCPDPSQFESLQFKPDADGHIFLLHLDEIVPLANDAQLQIKDIKLFTNPLTNGHIKLEAALKVLPRSWVSSIETITKTMPLPLQRRINRGIAVLMVRPETA